MFEHVRGAVGKLFGKGVTPRQRTASTILDEISPDNVPDGALAALWEALDARYPETNRRVRDSIDLRAGKKRAPMHPNWSMEDRENLRADGPEKYEEPDKLKRRLGGKKGRIKRPAAGIEPKALAESTKIEDSANGYLDEDFPDIEVNDLLLNEGETLVITAPMPSHWESIKTLYDEFEEEGKHASKDEYDEAPEHRKREYEKATADDEQPRYKRMRKRYRVNGKGEGDDDSPDFKTDLKRSAKLFRDEMEDFCARRKPVKTRGPISRLDFIPINPVFSGKATEIDGAIIRTLYRKAKLRREYKWAGCDNTELLEATSAYDGIDGELYLYELWAYDEDHRPFVAYQVGTHSTEYEDSGTTAVVKLWEEYPGVTELPIAYEPGIHNAGSNADLRTRTYTQSRQQNWLQRDAVLTQVAISTAVCGYPSWIEKMTPEGVEAMRMLGGDADTSFVAEPNVVRRVFGDVTELASRGPGPGVEILLGALNALGDKGAAPEGAFGGEGPSSGLDRQVQGRDLELAFGDVIEGYRRIKEKCGRNWLMLATALGRKFDRPVELYVMSEAAATDGSGERSTAKRVPLPPDICGDNWDVICEFPQQLGEDLAATSLNLSLYQAGVLLLREMRDQMGDPHPERFVAEKALEDYFTKNPAGQLDVLTRIAQYINDSHMKQMLELTAQQKMTSADGGIATPLMDDMVGAEQAGPEPPGMQLPDRGQLALAGANAGAMNASAAASGSPLQGGVTTVGPMR